MATYDLTAKSTTGVSADSNTNYPSQTNPGAYVLEKELNITRLVADGTFDNVTSGDVFQLLEIPANTIVLVAGANVTTAFTGGSATADIDFAAGDDIIDGGDISSTGYLAAGSNGQTNTIVGSAATTFTQLVSTADTIDVTIAATDTACVSGVIRVYAVVLDIASQQTGRDEVDRDLLA